MKDKIIKIFRATVKSIDETEHTITVGVSTADVDRDLDKLPPESFRKRLKYYRDHPVLVSSHNYSKLTNQIGEAAKVSITEDGLEAKFKYYVNEGNPEADWAWVLASKGAAAFSVGFIPWEIEEKDYEKDGYRRLFTDVELVEISQVIVPSNRGAVQMRRSTVLNLNEVEKGILEFVEKGFASGELKEMVTKPEDTGDFIRIPLHNSDNYEGIRTIVLSADEGIKALAGKLKSGDDKSMHIITVLFEKAKGWTMEKARKWIDDHKDKMKEFDEVAQKAARQEIRDQLLEDFKAMQKEFVEIIVGAVVAHLIKEIQENGSLQEALKKDPHYSQMFFKDAKKGAEDQSTLKLASVEDISGALQPK